MHDVIIIGGAFAGLAAATQLGRARRNVLVLDTGLPRNRFAAHSHGFFTRDGAPPLELIAEARRQLAIYKTVELRTAHATGASRDGDTFIVELESGEKLNTRRIILAHGMSDDLSALPPGADACWGKSVFTCPYCHGYEFGDQRLGLLLRMGDVLDLARFYKEWTSSFTLFTNGNPVDDIARTALADMNVPIIDDTVLSFEHEAGNLRAIVTAGGKIPLDAMFAHPPARLSTNIGVELGCELKDGHLGPFYATDNTQLTTIPGVYAAGDAANPMPSISYAVAAGVAAGTFAHRSLLV
ncbi:MAG: NAD(P)/FAD-dependent oxidoreductase [Devosia sp.]